MAHARLLTGREAVEAFFYIITLPHNFKWFDDKLQRLIVMFDMGNMIMNGEIMTVCSFDDDDRLVGLHHGIIEGDTLYDHVFFVRHSKANIDFEGMSLQVLKETHPEVKRMVGTIPDNNRAAKIYALKNGFKEVGEQKNVFFTQDGIKHKVILFEKEI